VADTDPAGTAAGLRLTCRPGKSGNTLVFPYTLENQGPGEIYAMHAVPSVDPASGEARANENAAVVIASEGGDAIVGKFIAPLPTDRRIALPIFPLARRLPAGASIEGNIEIPMPLAETSPYFADLPLRRFEMIDIKGVEFIIGYWLAAPVRMSVEPCEYAPDLFVVSTRDPARAARRISQSFPTTGLQLFKRTDAFPRSLG
jgi:hypothetical protein